MSGCSLLRIASALAVCGLGRHHRTILFVGFSDRGPPSRNVPTHPVIHVATRSRPSLAVVPPGAWPSKLVDVLRCNLDKLLNRVQVCLHTRLLSHALVTLLVGVARVERECLRHPMVELSVNFSCALRNTGGSSSRCASRQCTDQTPSSRHTSHGGLVFDVANNGGSLLTPSPCHHHGRLTSDIADGIGNGASVEHCVCSKTSGSADTFMPFKSAQQDIHSSSYSAARVPTFGDEVGFSHHLQHPLKHHNVASLIWCRSLCPGGSVAHVVSPPSTPLPASAKVVPDEGAVWLPQPFVFVCLMSAPLPRKALAARPRSSGTTHIVIVQALCSLGRGLACPLWPFPVQWAPAGLEPAFPCRVTCKFPKARVGFWVSLARLLHS